MKSENYAWKLFSCSLSLLICHVVKLRLPICLSLPKPCIKLNAAHPRANVNSGYLLPPVCVCAFVFFLATKCTFQSYAIRDNSFYCEWGDDKRISIHYTCPSRSKHSQTEMERERCVVKNVVRRQRKSNARLALPFSN